MRRHRWRLAIIAWTLLLTGCPPQLTETTDEARTGAVLRVCVSIPPQAFFVERIGGDRASVDVLVGPGQSPATYEPTPAQMAGLDEADVFFRIGVPFEDALMNRISASMPHLNVVDLREDIELQPVGDLRTGHEHGRLDPHSWLDPELAAIQARTIHDEFVRLDGDAAGAYGASLEALQSDLEQTDEDIAEMLAPLQGREVVVFHPAFGYFTRAYGLTQVAIEIEGKEPAPKELQRVIEMTAAEGFHAIFVQPQFSNRSARAIAAEVDATIIELDPLARDYLTNLREIARKIRNGLTAIGAGTDR